MNRPLILTDPTGLQAGAQKPPTSDEIDLEGTRRDPGREGYQLVIVGSTSIAINNGVVTDEDGNVIKDHGLKDVTEKTNGFGIIVRYALSSGSFPAPDKDAKTTFEEVISNSTLNGERNTRGDVAEAPVEGKLVDGQIQFNDWVGTRSDQPGGPASVSEGDQTIKIRTTINGNREEPFVVRTNRIVINPRDKVKIKILDTTPKEQDEFEPLD
ncbi:MAG TPA: hypothetical protein DEP46_17045 [Blastocatellia bacterium]|nr:hypothetical protein [Blastocatellia bacterium]